MTAEDVFNAYYAARGADKLQAQGVMMTAKWRPGPCPSRWCRRTRTEVPDTRIPAGGSVMQETRFDGKGVESAMGQVSAMDDAKVRTPSGTTTCSSSFTSPTMAWWNCSALTRSTKCPNT